MPLAQTARKAWLSLMAKAPDDAILALWKAQDCNPDFTWLRRPETGTVMVRGRAGGTGAPFNLGEMTVTRCTIQLDNGTVGHGYVQGGSHDKARAAALADAMMQGHAAEALQTSFLTPLSEQIAAAKAKRARKAAATKVDFFTMVRGED
ncbi:phosphonate C-P lyase system protein PhnG [Aliiroseovarius sp. PrR006]|uniref:phosphonate C-P lyase system protein PhnG n=1 Tax=Aliiroseovarius sp. PrR006 TaxID=2706883 RepID=UPI001EF28818|nr:phosphonate C-P lyase system protein PhnG [Aliiroseovarius sp. PrR006]